MCEAYINDRKIFTCARGTKTVTDMSGGVISRVRCDGDESMKKKHTGLIIAATSIFMTALVILNLFVFNSCMSKAKKYAAENMLAILQTIRINKQNKAFDEGKIAENQANVIFTAIENSDKEAI